MPDEHQPTLAELGRRLIDLRDDIAMLSNRFDSYLLKAVYEANLRAQDERMARLDDDRRRVERDLQAAKDNARNAWRWAVGSFASPIIVGVILAWMLGGGL